ncbi:IS66-like element accessory protein TnpA [Salinarimonas rosea]|uniref:IS66-like element accessory protein TnpA n=1 Tax=Salinarimonas rosea TaxID=552063 RepID=UPI000694912B
MRSGRRRWSDAEKGRIVRESFEPGAVVNEVARRHGITPQQLTGWRREARQGRLVLIEEPEAEFVPLAIEDANSAASLTPMIAIAVGRVVVRACPSTPSTRIAEIAAALEARL